MPRTNVQPQRSTNHDAFERHQHALETLKNADRDFARALTRALVPDTTRRDPSVIRRRTR